MPKNAKKCQREKIDLRVVISDPEDIKKWNAIKKYLHIKIDTQALRVTIRSYFEKIGNMEASA